MFPLLGHSLPNKHLSLIWQLEPKKNNCYEFANKYIYNRPVSSAAKHIDIDARGLGFKSWVGQIGHSVANGMPPRRRFLEAVLPKALCREDGSRHSLHALAYYPESNEDF